MKIITWNIAGARPIKSLDQFDYEKEDVDYFANWISKYNPDIVCLQEVHTNAKKSISADLAKFLNMPYVFNLPRNKSHIDSDYLLGDAILSKKPFLEKVSYEYPNQWDEYYFKDGTKAAVHYKTLQVVKVDNVFIANTQMLPIAIFGHEYDKDEGVILSRNIESILQNLHRPLIFCGDFNFSSPNKIYSNFFKEFDLTDALPDVSTRPVKSTQKKRPDHILFSSEFKLVESDVVKTNSDHYMCYANLELKQ